MLPSLFTPTVTSEIDLGSPAIDLEIYPNASVTCNITTPSSCFKGINDFRIHGRTVIGNSLITAAPRFNV